MPSANAYVKDSNIRGKPLPRIDFLNRRGGLVPEPRDGHKPIPHIGAKTLLQTFDHTGWVGRPNGKHQGQEMVRAVLPNTGADVGRTGPGPGGVMIAATGQQYAKRKARNSAA